MEKKQVICDTDVIIDLFNQHHKRHLATKKVIDKIGIGNVVISAISKMELIKGAQNKEYLSSLNTRLSDFKIAFINQQITELSIGLLLQYNLSHGLELPDSIIAATAIYTNFELFTYNTKDYKFIAGLNLYK